MLKVEKGKMEIAGTAKIIAAETAGLIRHVFTSLAEHDKIAAAAAFNTAGRAMADAAEDLIENYGIDLEMLNIHDDEDEDDDDDDVPEKYEDEDLMHEFLNSLSPKELKALLDIIAKFDDYADEEDD